MLNHILRSNLPAPTNALVSSLRPPLNLRPMSNQFYHLSVAFPRLHTYLPGCNIAIAINFTSNGILYFFAHRKSQQNCSINKNVAVIEGSPVPYTLLRVASNKLRTSPSHRKCNSRVSSPLLNHHNQQAFKTYYRKVTVSTCPTSQKCKGALPRRFLTQEPGKCILCHDEMTTGGWGRKYEIWTYLTIKEKKAERVSCWWLNFEC